MLFSQIIDVGKGRNKVTVRGNQQERVGPRGGA
jgi:hypothetical protein